MHKTFNFKNTKINADIYLQSQDYSRGPKLLKNSNSREPLSKLMESTFKIFFHPAGALEESRKKFKKFLIKRLPHYY